MSRGTVGQLKSLCWSLEDCFGFVTQNDTMADGSTPGSDRGYLLTYECGSMSNLVYEKGTALYRKMDPTYDTCPLGEVMTVYGGSYPEVSGAYVMGNTDVYHKVGGLA